ncbi:MAG: ATP-binding cassette domain-containing protein [Candidatus Pararuminococcus gallinarum]|jgi:putative ABC transport system permease protein
MLQIKRICKQYKTGNLVQQALDHVSLNLRDNEFVAILGPSGSGKTTLLNIIGGLDRYDSGDLIINGISTKKYKDRDWDSYRNHTIGFVFQSYNLIPHQTVLANVELALTISGVSKAERRKRAIRALEQVGLGEQIHKRPNQMSGGQMQRVAIARALVNDPDILLADEPTGALDSETSVQVMELLKEVAKDRLVVMVTHNPELAELYATRIVKLKDGTIRSDSDPYEVGKTQTKPIYKNMGKSSMSLLTALSLSFNNLRTKKARTILTSFAGSIGIIGIALILSISNGVNSYIQTLEEETLSEYPLQIQKTTMNFSAMMSSVLANQSDDNTGDVKISQTLSSMFSGVDPNDLESLKQYLDSGSTGIEPYAKAVEYSYDVAPQIFSMDGDNIRQVNPDHSFSALGIGTESDSFMSSMMSTDVFYQMPENTELFREQYDVKAGRWPQRYNECVVVLTPNGSISDFMLYTLGLRDPLELDEMIQEFLANEAVDTPDNMGSYNYEDFLGISFKLVNASDYYEYDSTYDVWTDKSDDDAYMQNLVSNGEDITIVGVVQPAEDASAAMLSTGIAYPASLTEYVVEQAADSPIVQEQIENPDVNVLTGNSFGEDNGQSPFDLDSLFTIDEGALQNAFGFDTGAIEIDWSNFLKLDDDSLKLSDLVDPDEFTFDFPDLPDLTLEDLMGELDLSISPEGIKDLASNLLAGYNDYAVEHPEADYSHLDEYLMAYLQTPEAQQILEEGISQIIQSDLTVTVSPEQLQELVQNIMSGFQEYAASNGWTDPDRFSEYLALYLQTPEAQQIIAEGAADVLQISGEITISPEQIQALISGIMSGYQEYAIANQLPDPSKMGEHFSAYLQTPQAQQQIAAGIAGILDTETLQAQLSSVLGNYMQTMMSSFTEAIMQAMQNQISSVIEQLMGQIATNMESGMQQAMEQLGNNLGQAFQIDSDTFHSAIQMNMSEEELTELLRSLMSGEDASYENNLTDFGYADLKDPNQISIYPYDFSSKAAITEILDDYNSRMEAQGDESKMIRYTDMVGTLMTSVTEIVDTISYVLVAFVAISLVVSSIMIGVITYISVLERKKEIGILRAIGASKHNISQVFNAETFIIGLCAGVIGIGLTLLLLIPGNALIHSLAGTTDINASLPAVYGVILIGLSVVLTLIGGLIPSRKAAKSDPVTALRAE